MVNAQEWLDKEYPLNRRNEITELDISKGKVKRWDGHERTLKGNLKLEGFTNLRILNCSGHELTSLDISEYKNLRELDCSSNKLNNLAINGCSKLKKINCVSNSFLEEIDISNCLEISKIDSDLVYNYGKDKLVKLGPQITQAKEDSIRNILIIGITGNGKSTLANVLNDTTQFIERASSASVTKNFQASDIFEWQGWKYRVIDNIGFGDTNNVAEEDLLYEIGKGVHSAKEGINQVLFVFKGRFSPEHVSVFDKFKKFISESRITEFTTIVRTHFKDFRSEEKYKADLKKLTNESQELNEIINSCKSFIYVDNPPIPEVDDEDNEEEREDKEKRILINGKKRKESRERMLNHLVENCLEIYKLKEWDSIYSMVTDYVERKEEIEKSDSSTKEEELRKERSEVTKKIRGRLEIETPMFGMFGKYATEIEYTSTKLSSSSNETVLESTTGTKRNLSFSSQTETSREGGNKILKVVEEKENQSEPMEIDSPEQDFQIEVLPK